MRAGQSGNRGSLLLGRYRYRYKRRWVRRCDSAPSNQIGFRKSDNAFLAVDDVAALQTAADKLSAQIIRKRLDYWTLILGPKFSPKERKQINLSRFYAIAQIEYCRNFIFKRHFPIHKLFVRMSRAIKMLDTESASST